MHARATRASGKHVETFTQHYNEQANPSNEKMMGYLIYRAGELEVSKSTVIGIKSCQL